jgi:hypothetical protein
MVMRRLFYNDLRCQSNIVYSAWSRFLKGTFPFTCLVPGKSSRFEQGILNGDSRKMLSACYLAFPQRIDGFSWKKCYT